MPTSCGAKMNIRMAQTAMLGNKTVSQVLSDVSGANEIAFEAIDENLIPFTDALDADHGWLLSSTATGDGALSVLLTAQASGYRSARTPFIPYYLVRERDVALSFRAVAGADGTTLGISFELWHKGDTARYGRIDASVTLSTSTQSFSVLQTLSDAAFTPSSSASASSDASFTPSSSASYNCSLARSLISPCFRPRLLATMSLPVQVVPLPSLSMPISATGMCA